MRDTNPAAFERYHEGLIYSYMHSRDFYYDNYRNHPEHVLKRIVGDYPKLTAEAQEALRDVLQERNLSELLAGIQTQEQKKPSLAHLSPAEIRSMINQRIERGEKPEQIKADLQERGVNVFELSQKELAQEEEIEERFIELQKKGKSKEEIDRQLKEEFNLPGKEATKIPEKMYSNGSWLIVAGALCLLIGLPMAAVIVQSKITPKDYSLSGLLVGAGVILLGTGLRKRMVAQKFIRAAEKR